MKEGNYFDVIIQATVGSKQRFYIVSQSPYNDLTRRTFWQCVWEADVYLIVQLSDDTSYIPPNSNKRTEFGQVNVIKMKKKKTILSIHFINKSH